MKYAKHWKDLVSRIPDEYQTYSLDYKEWKKMTKEYDDNFLPKIEKECNRIEKFYKEEIHRSFHVRPRLTPSKVQEYLRTGYLGKKGLEAFLSAIMNRRSYQDFESKQFVASSQRVEGAHPSGHTPTMIPITTTITAKDENDTPFEHLLRLKTINRQSLYKICKRFDKKSGMENVYTLWFQTIAKKKYDFLKIDMAHRFLEWRVYNQKDACPICLEEDYNEFVIQKCGHVMCTDCIKQLAGSRRDQTTGVRGTLHNIIRNLQYHHVCHCPICRTSNALSRFKIVHEES